MTETKPYCVLCDHCYRDTEYYCGRPQEWVIDPVTGRVITPSMPRCRDQRASIMECDCGPAGRFFTPDTKATPEMGTPLVELQLEKAGQSYTATLPVPDQDVQKALTKEWNQGYRERRKGFQECQSFKITIQHVDFTLEEFVSDHSLYSITTRITGPSGTTFVRHFGDYNHVMAFLAHEIKQEKEKQK